MYDFIVVGAGISGCLAAKKLSESDHKVLVIEKSRGPGGRMSSRRVDSPHGQWRFDHGAQFFTARDSRFQKLIEASLVCKPWHDQIPHRAYEEAKTSKRWIGLHGMNSLAKEWAESLPIHTEERVIRVQAQSFGWELFTDRESSYKTKHLVLSCPIPQCVELLKAQMKLPDEMLEFSYDACWTILFGAYEEFRLNSPYAFWCDPSSGVDWVCDNQKKGISNLPALSVQLTADKSKEFINSSSEAVIQLAKDQLREFLPPSMAYEAAHRWLYATPKGELSEAGFYTANQPAPVSIIGDAFYGGRVEGAVLSALDFLTSFNSTS
ncbi:MAG: NAD(P)/FAD-dependent oxidoreductase [Bdellovibrionota bacterium]